MAISSGNYPYENIRQNETSGTGTLIRQRSGGVQGTTSQWRSSWLAILGTVLFTIAILSAGISSHILGSGHLTEKFLQPTVKFLQPKLGALTGRKQSAIPRIVHTVWLNDRIPAFVLASIDSVARNCPDVLVKLHVMIPSDAHSVQVDAIRTQLTDQLSIFSHLNRFKVQLVLHSDVQAEMRGTPLADFDITQAHLGGKATGLRLFDQDRGDRENTFFGPHKMAMLHASDFMRLLVMREGGIYLDTDILLLRDIFPLVESIDSFVVCERRPDGQKDGRCNLVNAIFGFAPNHPFIDDCLKRIAEQLRTEWSVNDIWPIEPIGPGHHQACLTCIGTTLLSYVKNKWVDDHGDVWVLYEHYPHYATVINNRQRPEYPKKGMKDDFSDPPSQRSTSLTVVGRRYFMPTSWSEVTLNNTITTEIAESYIPAYATHLWEMDGGKNVIRPNFLSLIRSEPSTILRFLWRRACLVLCKDEDMDKAIAKAASKKTL